MTIISKRQASGSQLYWVADNIIADDFPPVSSALRDPDGLLAIGGDLGAERLLDAYRQGIFPWYSKGQPILWWSPNPRCVFEMDSLKISRSLRKTLRKKQYKITFNSAFKEVILACSKARKNNQDTWLTEEMLEAYIRLHNMGHAVSVECWDNEQLVGGLYGISIGKVFFGESMFSWQPDASKIALVHLTEYLKSKEFRLIDCQVYSKHLQSLGATPMPRELFVNILRHYCTQQVSHDWCMESVCNEGQ